MYANLKTAQRKITPMNILLLRASKNHTNHISYSFENDFNALTGLASLYNQ